MRLRDKYDFGILVNETEKLVVNEMEKQYIENDICKCQDCAFDVATLALNQLKPRYHVSLMGTIYARAIDNSEYLDDVKKAVNNAIKKVKKNPSHD